jgi:multiple sugar transport system substrate-binding protein
MFANVNQCMMQPGTTNKWPTVWCILLVGLLGACSGAPRKGTHAIEYWSSNNSGEIQFSKWAVDRWNLAQPDLPVKYQPVPEGQSSEEIILAAVVAGTTPDIYSNIWQGLVEFYSSSGILVPLDTLRGFMDFINERCDAATVQEITSSDGHIYQIPWKMNPIMTIYNKRLLREMGLGSMPPTYSAYLDAARRFRQDTNSDGYVDQWFGNTSVKLAWYQRLFNFYALYLAASDGMPMVKDGRANFNNEHAVEVFRFLQEVYRENYFSKQVESAGQDLFIAERFASKWTGPWEIEYLEKFKRPGFEYEFASMPVPDGHEGPVFTYCDPKSMVIFNTCKDPQSAFDFIRTMMSAEADLKFLKTTNQLPRRQRMDAIPDFRDFFQNHPQMQVFADQARFVKGADNSESLIEVFDIISQEYEACVLYRMKTPEQAIADAEKAVNVLLRSRE